MLHQRHFGNLHHVRSARKQLALPALAENRVALVIGEDAYQNLEPLQKAVADADAYGNLLTAKNFQVRLRHDLTYSQMNAEVAAS